MKTTRIILLTAALVIGLVFVRGVRLSRAIEDETVTHFGQRQLLLAEQTAVGIQTIFNGAQQYLLHFKDAPGPTHLADALATEDEEETATWRRVTGEGFSSCLRSHPTYTQIRYIDVGGQEIVRVDRDGERVRVIPQDQLLSQAERDFFVAAQQLNEGEIYVSRLEPALDHGGVVAGALTLRLITPVFDDQGRRAGIIVLNLLGEEIRAHVGRLSTEESVDIWVLDETGVELINITHPELEGHNTYEYLQQTGDKTLIALVTEMLAGGRGTAIYLWPESIGGAPAVKKLVAYTPLYPVEGQVWSVGVSVPYKTILATHYQTRDTLLALGGGIIAVILAGAFLIIRAERRRVEAEEQTRFSELLYRWNMQLQTATQVSRAASSILNVDRLIQQSVELIQERFGLYYAGLFLVNETGEWAVLRSGTGDAGRRMVEQGHKLEVGGNSMIGWCVAHKQARIALDVGAEAVRFANPLLPETRSEMALPLISHGQALGALTIQSTEEAAFSTEDITTLQTMGDQLANALEGARLYEQAQQEIAERELAEQSLRESEEQLRATLSSMDDLVFTLDEKGVFVDYYQPDLTTELHAPPEVFIGKPYQEVLPLNVVQPAKAAIETLKSTGAPQRFDYSLMLSGQEKWFSMTISMRRDTSGQFAGITAVARNITERVRVEQSLRKERNFAESLVNTAQTIILVLDVEGRIVRFNPYMETLSGYSLAEVQGQDWFSTFLPAQDHSRIRALFQKAVKDIQTRGNVNPIVTRDGREHQIEWNNKTLKDAAGNVVGVLAIGQDITERVRVEEEINRYTRQLAALHEADLAIAANLDLNTVLTQVLTEAQALLSTEAASVLLPNSTGDKLIFTAVVGIGSEVLKGTHILADAGIAGWVMREAQPVLITDVQTDPRFYANIDVITGLTTRSLLAVPLLCKGKTLGVIEVINRENEGFNEHDLDLLSTLAGSAVTAIENARLYEETTRRLAETRVLQEIMLASASTLNFDQMLTSTLQAIHRTLHIEYLDFVLPDESGERMVVHPSFIGFIPPPEGNLHLPMDGSVAGRVYTTGQPELIDDTDKSPYCFKCPSGELHSELAVPVKVDDRVVAVLNAESPHRSAFGEDDLRMFQAIAAQLGVMMENARLYQEIQCHVDELTTLHQISLDITAQLDLQTLLHSITEQAIRLIGGTKGGLYLYHPDEEELELVVNYNLSQDLIGARLKVGEGVSGRIIETGKPLIVDNYAVWQGRAAIYAQESFTSVLGVPLQWGEQLIGVINVSDDCAGHVFTEADVQRLIPFANQAAIAIENARLYEETARHLAETRVLQEIMLALASTLDFDQVLTNTLQAIHRTLHIEYLSFALPDETEGCMLVHSSLIGFTPPPEGSLHMPLEGSVTGRVYTTGQPELLDDTTETPYYFDCTPEKMLSELVVPVKVDDRVVAVLNAESPHRGAFGEDDLRMFQAIAAQLGVVMKNTRLYEAEREQRKLIEQSRSQLVQSEKLAATGRLAASLAHEINNPLQAIHNSLQLLLSFSLDTDEQREYLQMADEEVARLIGMVTRILDFARRPQQELRPTNVNDVIKKVLTLSGKYLQHRRIALRHDLSPDLPAVLAVSGELGQVFLNLVLNAVDAMPDGGTLRIASRLAEDGRLIMTFSDTGHGISPEHLIRAFEPFFSTKEQGTGLGLFVSHNIVRRHGGEITVQSKVDAGTTFTVWLPAARDANGVS